MKVLLDTHAFLWSITGDDRLSKTAEEIFMDSDNILFFSVTKIYKFLNYIFNFIFFHICKFEFITIVTFQKLIYFFK